QQAVLQQAALSVPVVQSGNFSLGVNLLMALVEKTAAKLNEFDIEVTEVHHRRKVDAPSGTALMLGEAAAHGRGTSLSERGVFTRHGQVGPRSPEEIGFSVVRGGGVYGDHDVSFMSDDEVITLSHRALSRTLFAQGAIRAARWVVGRPPGLYSMRDVLEIDAS
ncbi:MAG: 4-hydroxy-tetrahydrodipicolinate reductase, partial [Pseudomonadota bacterium]